MCNFQELLKLFGQKKMAESFPVVIASDQSAIRVTLQGTSPVVIPGIVTVNQGTSPWVVSGAVTVSGAVSVTQSGTWDITNITGTIVLPTGASTSVLQTAGNASLASIDSKLTNPLPISGTVTVNQGTSPWVVSGTVAATQSGAWTTGRTWTLSSGTDSVTVTGTVAATQSGVWNITDITGTISLPTGASTSALQTTGNASLASIDAKLTNPLPISGTVTANQGGSWTVTANAGTNLNTSALALAITQTDRTQKTQLTDGTRDGTIKAASTAAIAADTSLVVALSPNSPLPTGSNVIGALTANQSVNLNQYGGVATTLGQKVMAASMPVTIASDQSALAVTGPLTDAELRATPVPISGTVSISGTIPISGTVTANQGTSPWVTSISGTVAVTQSGTWAVGTTLDTNYGVVGANTLRTAAQIGNATGDADFAAGNSGSQTLRVVVASDQLPIPVNQSGTWDINNITGTISLPTGASTSALQTAGNASLASIDAKLTNPLPISGTVTVNQGTSPWVVSGTVGVTQSGTWSVGTTLDTNYGTVGANTLRTAAQIGNATGAADFNTGAASAQTLRVTIPSIGPVTPGTVAAASTLMGGQFNTVLPTLTNTQQSSLQVDSSGRLIISPVTTTIAGTVTVSNFPTTVDTNYGTVGVNTIRTAAQIGNATGAAAFNAGTTTAQVLRVVLPTDQTAIPVVGNAASGTAKSGAPVQTGAVYNSTLPTVTTGQIVENQADANGRLIVNATPVDGTKPTYRASIVSNALAALTTDFFTITGSASKTIRINIIDASFTGGGAIYSLQIVRRSTANTGGTSTTPAAVPNDTTNPAATAVVRAYTVNPTLGTLVGAISAGKLNSPLASSTTDPGKLHRIFGERGQCIVLRGASQVLAINGNGVTGPTNATCYIEWMEED